MVQLTSGHESNIYCCGDLGTQGIRGLPGILMSAMDKFAEFCRSREDNKEFCKLHSPSYQFCLEITQLLKILY